MFEENTSSSSPDNDLKISSSNKMNRELQGNDK